MYIHINKLVTVALKKKNALIEHKSYAQHTTVLSSNKNIVFMGTCLYSAMH